MQQHIEAILASVPARLAGLRQAFPGLNFDADDPELLSGVVANGIDEITEATGLAGARRDAFFAKAWKMARRKRPDLADL